MSDHDNIAYYQDVIDHLREKLDEKDDPSDWSDSDKLRLIAALFDEADLVRGVTDQHEVQEDLRRIADLIDDDDDLEPGPPDLTEFEKGIADLLDDDQPGDK